MQQVGYARPRERLSEPVRGRSGMRGMWWRLSLLGLVGVASLLLVPMEELIPVDIDPVMIRLAATIQPALFVLAFAAIGVWAAPRVGLDAPAIRAWAESRSVWPALRPQLPAAVGVGLVVAFILLGYVWALPSTGVGETLLRFAPPLAARLLYGGLTEELLMRWGLMSLLVWIAWRLAGRTAPVPAWCYRAGVTLAALLFAVGHLPALFLLAPDAPSSLVLMVLACNFVPGLLFGWLFWRRGLEAAMAAHAFAHLFAWAALLAV